MAALCGSPVRAQVRLLSLAEVAVIGEPLVVAATRMDQRPAQWVWSAVLNGQPVDPRADPRFMIADSLLTFQPHRRDVGTLLLRATDLADGDPPQANPSAEFQFRLVPAMLALSGPAQGELSSGQAFTFRLSQADGQQRACIWEVLEAGGGSLQAGAEAGVAHYQAPWVARPATFHIQVRTPDGHQAIMPVRVRPALTLAASSQEVVAGGTATLTAARRDGTASTLGFRVLEPGGGTLTLEDGKICYHAPAAAQPRTCTVEARDLNQSQAWAQHSFHILPRVSPKPEHDVIFQTLLPATMSLRAQLHVPQAALAAGQLQAGPDSDPLPTFSALSSLINLPKDPALGSLSESWLAADRVGIHRVAARTASEGTAAGADPGLPLAVTPLVAFSPDFLGDVAHGVLAVRPPGSVPDNPYRVLVASTDTGTGRSRVHEMKPDGSFRLLAGLSAGGLGHEVLAGRAQAVAFHRIHGLAAAADGTVYLAERNRVRQLDRQGRVTTLAVLQPDGLKAPPWAGRVGLVPVAEDEPWVEADRADLLGLALDPATGDLYLLHAGGLDRLTARGEVAALIPTRDPRGSLPEPCQPARRGGIPQGLHLHGRNLFIPLQAQHTVRVYNLDTGHLFDLLGGKNQPGTRVGPLGHFAPGLSAGDCAAVETPVAIALSADGTCLLGFDAGILHMELGAFFSVAPPAGSAPVIPPR